MAKGQGTRISDERRAVILAALLEGQSVTEVATRYKLPKTTISRLRKAIPAEKLAQVATQKGETLADMIAANLEKSFNAISNILNVTNNADWLLQQPAAELATLLGVTSDKIFRVLEAIENAQNNADENQDGS